MRILYLSPSGQLGGAERVLLDLFVTLKALNPGWHLYLIAGQDGPLVDNADKLGVMTQVVAFPASVATLGESSGALLQTLPAILRYARDLRRAIRAVNPDVVHTNGFKMHILGAWLSRKPLIWHMHDYISSRATMARAMRLSVFRCRAVVANSNSVADDCIHALRTRVPIHAMLNGVDLVRFAPVGDTLDLDNLSGLAPAPDGTFRVGLLATFARWKGHSVFLHALALARQTRPNIRGYIIGGPIYQTLGSQYSQGELRRLAISLGLAEHAGFTGFLTNAPAAMRSLDAVAHASTSPEPFGLVIAEAMACGRPIVVANAGGATEIVTPNHDALATTPGSVEELAAAILQLADGPDLCARLSRRARATIETRFSRARLAHSLAPLYLAARRSCKSSTSIAEISTAA